MSFGSNFKIIGPLFLELQGNNHKQIFLDKTIEKVKKKKKSYIVLLVLIKYNLLLKSVNIKRLV